MTLTPEMVESSQGNQTPSVSEPISEDNQSLMDAIEVTTGEDNPEVISPAPTEETSAKTKEEGATLKEGEEQEEVEKPPQEKQPYSNEEIAELLTLEQEVDTDRLTPEGKILMKSFQSGFNKKFEKLAEKQRLLDEKLNQPKEQPVNAREKYYQEFLERPEKVMAEINNTITELEADPYDEENRKNIAALRTMRDEFLVRKTSDSEKKTLVESKKAELYATYTKEIYDAIPDYEKKVPELNKLAGDLGLTMEDLGFICNPLNTGKYAAKLTKVLHKAYTIINAGKSAAKKIDKTPPKELGRSTGSQPPSVSVDLSQLPQEEFEKQWNKLYKH